MTLKKAYRTMFITIILMMLAIIFYAFEVSKLNLGWGIAGFSIASIVSISAVVFSLNTMKHEKEVKKTGFFHTHRFEILDWISFLSISLMIIFIVFSFFMLPSDVDQNSMYPTLKPHDRILISHFNYEPKRNDVVILRITKEDYPLVLDSMFYEYDSHDNLTEVLDEIYFVKRIMAIPGDKINFQSIGEQFRILVNDEIIFTPEGEQYLVTQNQRVIMENDLINQILIEGRFMTFGDNPNGFTYIDPQTQLEISIPGSFDSRSFGAIKEDHIIGKVVFKLWPFGGIQ
ncbi:MAG: signal peptidase I [Acholeplasmataceae bacterium]|jgi:signal peptidase I|nr:signal peptidase I [Acholeplasmataceae bacterium]